MLTQKQIADRLLKSLTGFFSLLFRELPRLILLNILFWGMGLFVVTLPLALTGLFGVLSDYISDKRPETALTGYWEHMTARPITSLCIGTGYAAALAFAFLLAGFYLGAAREGQALMYLPLAVCVLLCVFLLWCGFYFPLLLAANLPPGAVIKGALMLAAGFPVLNAALLAILAFIAAVIRLRPVATIVIFAGLGFSFLGLIITYACLPIAKEHVINPYELRMSRLRRTGTNAAKNQKQNQNQDE